MGRLNLNFQAPPYGVAFMNPWNMPKYPIQTWNSKMDFKVLKQAIFWLKFLKTQFLNFWLNLSEILVRQQKIVLKVGF